MYNNQKLIKYDVDKTDEPDMRKLYTDQQLKIEELNNNIKNLTKIVENKNSE